MSSADVDSGVVPAEGARPPERRITVARLPPWTALHLVSLGMAGAVLLFLNRNQWFVTDEWTFIFERGEHQTVGLFTPHFEHWSTVPALVFKLLLGTVGLDSYLPYVAVLVVVHLALTHLLWRISVRAGARPAIATGVAGVFSVLGAGSDNLLWAFQIGMVGSVALGWLAVLLHDHDGPFDRRDVGGWLASVVALMSAGPALVFVAVAAATVTLRRRRWLDGALTAAVPAAVFGLWWLIAGRHGRSPVSAPSRWDLVDYAWTGISHAVETVVGVPSVGGFLVLALALWWVREPDRASGPAAVAAAGAVGAFGFFVLAGIGRAAIPATAAFPRYIYVAAALLVPAAALVLSRITAPTQLATGVVLGLCGLVAVHNLALLREAAGLEASREQPLKELVVTGAALLADDARIGPDPVPLDAELRITAEDMRRLVADGWRPDVEPTTRQRLAVAVLWQVGLDEATGDLGPGRVSAVGHGATLEAAGENCAVVRPAAAFPRVDLTSEAASWRVQVQVAAAAGGYVTLSDGDARSDARGIRFAGGRPQDLVSHASGATVTLTVPPGQITTICGVQL